MLQQKYVGEAQAASRREMRREVNASAGAVPYRRCPVKRSANRPRHHAARVLAALSGSPAVKRA